MRTWYIRIQCYSIVNCPDVVQHKLHEERLERAAAKMLVTNDPLRLWVKVKVSPQHGPEVPFFNTELDRIQVRELADAETPAVNR